MQTISHFEHKVWNIVVLLTLVFAAFSIQSFTEAKLNPDIVSANVSGHASMAMEAFPLSSTYHIKPVHSEYGGYYIAPGEGDIPIFSFEISSYEDVLLLKRLQLAVHGTVDNDMFVHAKLYEGEEKIATTRIQENIFSFKHFTSVLKQGMRKVYTVKLTLNDTAKPGSRFYVEIENPYGLELTKQNRPLYSLNDYPIRGDYVTVVGYGQ
ncbi:hypothetical protein GF369_03115 [Candidatus Peregrinibacteria bacterium]|nr:hypothetical protein [Candidatus Peregrinibacteria bacterium]